MKRDHTPETVRLGRLVYGDVFGPALTSEHVELIHKVESTPIEMARQVIAELRGQMDDMYSSDQGWVVRNHLLKVMYKRVEA